MKNKSTKLHLFYQMGPDDPTLLCRACTCHRRMTAASCSTNGAVSWVCGARWAKQKNNNRMRQTWPVLMQVINPGSQWPPVTITPVTTSLPRAGVGCTFLFLCCRWQGLQVSPSSPSCHPWLRGRHACVRGLEPQGGFAKPMASI